MHHCVLVQVSRISNSHATIPCSHVLHRTLCRLTRSNPRNVNPILLDRLKRIVMETPDTRTKIDIATRHILPRMRDATKCALPIDTKTIETIVNVHKDDKGMRGIERSLHELLSVALMCEQYGCQSIAGLEKQPMQTIDDKFTMQVLTRLHEGFTTNSPEPPPMMFI